MIGRIDDTREWLETDGCGGFAMGTASGIRTRRYHGLLISSQRPPVDRVALVKGLDTWIETPEGAWGLTTQRYADGHEAPDGIAHLVAFTHEPWPSWTYRLPSGLLVEHEVFMLRDRPVVCASWRLIGAAALARLSVRPLLGATDIHTLRRDADAMSHDAVFGPGASTIRWRPDARYPEIGAAAPGGAYAHDPVIYRGLLYAEEQARGFDHTEDLGSPGVFRWDLAHSEAALMLSSGITSETAGDGPLSTRERFERARKAEREARALMSSRLDRGAEKFLVARGAGRTIIAGYPWFGDWGRDTFIAMRGLCHSRERWDDARAILAQWAATVSEGMIPNRFTDASDMPEFNSVDASLWFVVAAGEYLDAVGGWHATGEAEHSIRDAISAILDGYARGTRHGIRMDCDGLLAAGEPGQQLTWMDARVNGVEVTARIGKPVEVQALWASALHFGARIDTTWARLLAQVRKSFADRFWNEDRSCLFDVVDADHVPGKNDATIRPNQVFAVGGLPVTLLDGPRAIKVVECVERELLTPVGLRTRAPGEPGYRPSYEGGPAERDGAYHQGTVWPWLMGAFVEAWVRVRGESEQAVSAANTRFLAPLLAMTDDAGLGGIAEIYDAEPPRRARGCPFQAWSVGEAIRLRKLLMGAPSDHAERVFDSVAEPRLKPAPAVPFS